LQFGLETEVAAGSSLEVIDPQGRGVNSRERVPPSEGKAVASS